MHSYMLPTMYSFAPLLPLATDQHIVWLVELFGILYTIATLLPLT